MIHSSDPFNRTGYGIDGNRDTTGQTDYTGYGVFLLATGSGDGDIIVSDIECVGTDYY